LKITLVTKIKLDGNYCCKSAKVLNQLKKLGSAQDVMIER